MLAFLLLLTLFAFWSLVGFGLFAAFGSQRNILRNALLSPIAGAAITALATAWTNVAGIPVRRSAPWITVVLVASSLYALRRRRPVFPILRLFPFLAVIVIGTLLVGYPLLLFGFNYVSFCNDDMANYALSAKLFLNHGFFDLPARDAVIHDQEASLFAWYLEVFRGMRPGSEEILAWVAGTTGLAAHQIFMITIIALYMALVAATGALILRNRRYRTAAWIACGWVAVSGLTALGVVYQLIAQVFGLGLVAGLSSLLLRPFRAENGVSRIRAIIPMGTLAAGVGLVYPEVIPFIALSFLLYHSILLVRRRETCRPLLAQSLLAVAAGAALLGLFLASTLSTLTFQITGHAMKGTASVADVLFPYYLLPSGFAHLWGFYPIGKSITWVVQPYIVLGAALYLFANLAALRLLWRGEACASVLAVMAALAIYLFRSRSDFGLYKIAMYMQPFLIGTVVLLCVGLLPSRAIRTPRRHRVGMLFVLVVMLIGMQSQVYYVVRSLAQTNGGGFVEIPHASGSRVISRLGELAGQFHPPVLVSDTSNIVVAKFEGAYLNGASLLFPAKDFFGGLMVLPSASIFTPLLAKVRPAFVHEAEVTRELRLQQYQLARFDMHGIGPGANAFKVRQDIPNSLDWRVGFLESPPSWGILNRRKWPPSLDADAPRVVPSARVRDMLLFIESGFGNSYYQVGYRSEGRVSMYQPEEDWYFPGRTMVCLGRDSLFRVMNPSSTVRLVLEYTASLNADGRNQIPRASVIGGDVQFFTTAGRGSARLISPPIHPQLIDGGGYLMLDMGDWGIQFPDRRSGIMKAYGTDIRLDDRRIVGFGRDISVISGEEYAALRPPSAVRRFPQDLANKDLEYSGIYEDGWVAESSYLNLHNSGDCDELSVSLMVPSIRGTQPAEMLILKINGQEVTRKQLKLGENRLTAKVELVAGKMRIELAFDRAMALPAPDNRPVSALIHEVALQRGTTSDTRAHQRPSGL
ncbi:MAG TPA: hypothetical protein VKX49_13950 [Bryobacteraceae bacterium]|nr:hypothetical protein [Bryobacteraceae bacterium]